MTNYRSTQEDDELERWLTEQAASARQPPAAEPQSRGSLASLIQPRDAEMDSRWRGAEQQALDRSGYTGKQSYGAGEAVRDFAPMAVGGVLDILLNKGRGVGAIAGAGMQANAQMAATRQKEAGQAADFATQARNQRESASNSGLDAAYKDAQIQNWQEQRDLGRGNLQQRDIKQQFQEMKLRLEHDPNDPQALAMAAQLKEITGMDVMGQLGAQNQGRIMPVAGRQQQLANAQPMAAASEQGRIDTDLANAPATTAAAANKETATTLANKAAANPELDATGKPIMPPGVDLAGSGYATLAQRNPTAAAKVIQSDMDIESLKQAHSNLSNIRAQIDAIPLQGRTRNNPEFARLYGQWQTDKGAYQTKLFDAQNRGVPQAFEQKLFDVSVGDPQTWEDAAANPVAAGRSALTDQGAMMKGQAEAIARSQQQFRQKWGFQAPQQAPQPTAAAPGGPSTARPGQAFNVPLGAKGYNPKADTLGDVNPGGDALGSGPTPKVPVGGAPPSPMQFRPSGMQDGSVYVTDPATGRTKRVTREAAAAAGWNGR